jgi:hypothetical protein
MSSKKVMYYHEEILSIFIEELLLDGDSYYIGSIVRGHYQILL